MINEFLIEIFEEYKLSFGEKSNNTRVLRDFEVLFYFYSNFDNFNFGSFNFKGDKFSFCKNILEIVNKIQLDLVSKDDLEQKRVSFVYDIYLDYLKFKESNDLVDMYDVKHFLIKLLNSDNNVKLGLKKKFEGRVLNCFKRENQIFSSLNSDLCSLLGVSLKEGDFGISRNSLDFLSLTKVKSQKAQLTFIAEKISSLKDDDLVKDIYVVLPNKSKLEEVGSFLSALNVDFGVYDEDFFRSELFLKLFNLLKIIESPQDRNIEFFGFLDDIIFKKSILKNISRKASLAKKPIYDFLVLNLEDSDLADFGFSLDEGEVFRSQVFKLKELVELNQKGFSDLDVFVRKVVSSFDFYSKLTFSNNLKGVDCLNAFLKLIFEVKEKFSFYQGNLFSKFVLFLGFLSNSDLNVFRDFNFKSLFDSKVFLENDVRVNLIEYSDVLNLDNRLDYVIVPYLNEDFYPRSYIPKIINLDSNVYKTHLANEQKLFLELLKKSDVIDLIYVDIMKSSFVPSRFLNLFSVETLDYSNELDLDSSLDSREKLMNEISVELKDSLKIGNYKKSEELVSLFSKVEGLNLSSQKSSGSLNRFLKEESSSEDFSSFEKLNYLFEEFKAEQDKDNELDIDMGKMVYSVSQLNVYKSCPKKYSYQYVYKIPGVARHYFDFGTSVHTVLEDNISKIQDLNVGVDGLVPELIADLHKKWISKGYQDEKQEKEYFEKGVLALKEFVSKERELQESQNRKTVSCEEKFLIDIEGRKMIGFIDRIDEVDGNFEVLDYKTSNSMELDSKLKENLQLNVYAFALSQMEKFNVFPKKVGLWYLVHNKIKSIDVNLKTIDKIKEDILKTIIEIEKLNFDAKPSKFACTYCDYNQICKKSFLK